MADHHGYGFRVRQHFQDILDDDRKVYRARDDDVIFREAGTLNSTLLYCRERRSEFVGKSCGRYR